MENKYLQPSLDMVEEVFTQFQDAQEGRMVRALVEEIRAKEFYVPQLELLMVDEQNSVIGYAMFSRFHLGGRYQRELLLLTPVAVKTELQRQHISKDLLEYGFEKAREMGFLAALVEGDPKNYNPRGFRTSADFGIVAGPRVHLPHVSCLWSRSWSRALWSISAGWWISPATPLFGRSEKEPLGRTEAVKFQQVDPLF